MFFLLYIYVINFIYATKICNSNLFAVSLFIYANIYFFWIEKLNNNQQFYLFIFINKYMYI